MTKYCQSPGCFREPKEHSLYCDEHLGYIPGVAYPEKKGAMNDVELFAISVLAMQQAVLMQGENDVQKLRNEYPVYRQTTEEFSPAGYAVRNELAARGIIKI